jgi:hypothetical protein
MSSDRIRTTLASLLALMVGGCAAATGAMVAKPGNADESQRGLLAAMSAPSGKLTESLFKDDQSVISNEDIARILAARVELPQDAKMIVVHFGQRPSWWGWSEEIVRVNQQSDDELIERLGSIKSLKDVALLPTLVTPAQMTIPHLRQAAARCQADLILIYRAGTHSYDRQRLFSGGEVRAYCTVEGIVLDTRTGTIPFSTIVTETFAARRDAKDIDFNETVAKANQRAIAKARLSLADDVKRYFDARSADVAHAGGS